MPLEVAEVEPLQQQQADHPSPAIGPRVAGVALVQVVAPRARCLLCGEHHDDASILCWRCGITAQGWRTRPHT